MNKITSYIAAISAKNAGKQYFDRLMIESMNFKQCEVIGKSSKILVELPVMAEWLNSGGTLHGGAISTLIDQATTIAVAVLDERLTVSIDLSVSFIAALKQGNNMQIEAYCHKVGKSLSFSSAEIKSNGNLIASGKHTKFMLNTKWNE